MARREAPGCRETLLATAFLLGAGIVLFATGLGMIGRQGCRGLCETIGLTLLYTGGPVSALLGVLGGGVTIAWPLDVTLWVVLGFMVARRAAARAVSPLPTVVAVLGIALVFGLVLSQFVELAV